MRAAVTAPGWPPPAGPPGAGHRPVLTFAGRLLDQAGHAIQPGPHQLTSLADLTSFASAQGITAPPEIKTAR
jgi:hypothetical protein